MTDGDREPADDRPDLGDGGLEPLKDSTGPADETVVFDGVGDGQRMTWNPVTDAGGTATDPRANAPAPSEVKSSFQFDLGGALARLAGSDDAGPAPQSASPTTEDRSPSAREEPTSEPLPMRIADLPTRGDRAPDVDPLPSRDDRVAHVDPLPTRGDRAADAATAPVVSGLPADAHTAQYPRRVPGTHLDSQLRETEPEVPEIREATPVDAPPRAVTITSVFDDGGAGVAGARTLPGLPNSSSGAVPSLPASNPVVAPAVVDPIGLSPSPTDINALRSAQLRASRQQRQGKLFGRSLLAFVLMGGVIAAALVFGRSLLFDTAWDAELTPIVNEVEAARGAEFTDTVPLAIIPSTELGDRLRTTTIGDAWVDRVPEWRALGLATGSVTAESVGAALSATTTATYDPVENRIYLAEGAAPDVAARDLRVALERAFDTQSGAGVATEVPQPDAATGFTGVSSLQTIATRAVDDVIAAGGAVAERRPADESLPFPIAYELAAVEVLGEPILASVGATASELTLGGPYPDGVTNALDDEPNTAASALIQPGEVSVAPPMALGTDDWSLVWGARLPETTVDALVAQVVADSYRPVDRGGTVCVIAVFQTADDASGSSVFTSMLAWTAGAPPASQAVATQLSSTRVQLEVCDPGVDGGSAPNIGVVDALIDRQQLRLTN